MAVQWATLPALPQAATIGGFDYAVQYDYRDFFAAKIGRAHV